MSAVLTRRRLLTLGADSVALAVALWLGRRPLQARAREALLGAAPLPQALREVLSALVPVLLEGMLPGDEAGGADARRAAVQRTVGAVEQAIARLGLAAQGELAQLFALLSLAPTRRLLAGLARPWAEATPAELRAFLNSWRHGRLGTLRAAYQALHDLTLGAWYAQPESWAAIGYPGPPPLADAGHSGVAA